MQTINTPELGFRYWITVSVASVFGCNTGDVVSELLGLGYLNGLPILAAIFALIMIAERYAKVGTEVYYWLAIIVIRTAATNLGDFTTDEMEWPYWWVIAGFAVLLVLTVTLDRARLGTQRRAAVPMLPATTGYYWVAMLFAGILGTVVGDEGTYDLSLNWSIVCFVALVFCLVSRNLIKYDVRLYWTTIVAIRAAGTNIGDYVTFNKGFALGLPLGTTLTGLLFFGLVLFWKRRDSRPV
jgi:uncharacterized membrane-anchored protein